MNTNYPYDDTDAPPPGWAEPGAPAGSFAGRIQRGASPDSKLLQRLQAHQLIDALAARGIRLRLDGELIKWSTLAEPITLGEMRQVKRLTPALKTILQEQE